MHGLTQKHAFLHKSCTKFEAKITRSIQETIFEMHIVQTGCQMMKCHKPREEKKWVIRDMFLVLFSDVSSPEEQNEEKSHITKHIPKELIVFRAMVLGGFCILTVSGMTSQRLWSL